MKGSLRRCSSLHTSSSSSSSSKFGSFILLSSADTYARSSTSSETSNSLIMLSSSSSSSSSVSESDESSECGDWPWRYDDGKVFHLGGSKDQSMKVELDNDEEDQQQLVVVLKSLGFPLFNESCFKHIIGSCEGLVCLSDSYIANLFCLWNPVTKTSRILPKPEEIGGTDHLFAFGFDVETKDYKVVKVTGFCDDEMMYYRPVSPIECICRVQVYSLSTDSWRLLEGITCLPGDPFGCPGEEGVLYLKGSCFFLANFFHTRLQPCFPESDRFIISFDFTKEIITPIQLPDHHHQDQKLYLSSLGDQMALFTKSYHHNGTEDYNIWVWKEHNGSNNIRSVSKESWTNLHSFLMEPKNPGESYTPIGLSNDGEFALLQTCGSSAFGKKIKLYHFATEEVKSFLSCNAVRSKAIAYKPSLVSIIGGNGTAAATTDRRRR